MSDDLFDNEHVCRIGTFEFVQANSPLPKPPRREDVEPWLAAILQSEHLSLLLGNGFSMSVSGLAGADGPKMDSVVDVGEGDLQERVAAQASKSASRMGRGAPNLEDYLRTSLALEDGLEIAGDDRAAGVRTGIDAALAGLLSEIVASEKSIASAGDGHPSGEGDLTVDGYLVSFLLTFASRTPSRDRLHMFTTNYDRLVEHGADLAGLRVIDRFVGSVTPRFRASRMDIDMHYNPPGLQGEPRFLEGVARFTKLHGSIDWATSDKSVVRNSFPFGEVPPERAPGDLLVWPNSMKDYETTEYPYAELFRDFSAAVCRPNSVLVTYGYGFGDDHINRVIADMLTIPSTHLLAISFDSAGGRIKRFVEQSIRDGQVSLLLGDHFGSLQTLVDRYLPRPAADDITWKRVNLLRRRMDRDASPEVAPKDEE